MRRMKDGGFPEPGMMHTPKASSLPDSDQSRRGSLPRGLAVGRWQEPARKLDSGPFCSFEQLTPLRKGTQLRIRYDTSRLCASCPSEQAVLVAAC